MSLRAQHLLKTNYGSLRGLIRILLGQFEYVVGRLDKHLFPIPKNIERLVFVCLGNINRSAFAEGVARKYGAKVCSIGLCTTTGAPAFHSAITTAIEWELDLTSHLATDITDYTFQKGDLLLAMEIRHIETLVAHCIPAEAISLLGHWSRPHRIHLHDPHTLSDEYFRTCFTLIHSAVSHLIAKLRSENSPCVR